MNLDNILGNLTASFIWVFLIWQVGRLRNRMKLDQQRRIEISERMRRIFEETHIVYSTEFRQDDILAVEIMMNMSRRLVSQYQAITIVSVFGFFYQLIVCEIYPKSVWAKVLVAITFFTLCFNAYYMFKHSSDVDAFEDAALKGLKSRNLEKLKAVREAVAKNPQNELEKSEAKS